MATLVSTGQLTIVDTNDARPITAYLSSNPGIQQVFSKDESTVAFLPSWYTANANTGIQITAKVYVGTVGGATDATAQLTNRKFCLTLGGTAVTTATTSTDFVDDAYAAIAGNTPFTVTHDTNGSNIKIRGNLKETVASWTIFFEGDYTDPTTSLTSHVVTQITLSTVKTGTNAVFITTRGSLVIEEATGSTKNVVAVAADLVRSSGVDVSGLTYKWFESGGSAQISTSTASVATKYGLKTVAAGVNPTATATDLNVNIPAAGAGNAFNTLVISEAAVTDIGIYKVQITDSDTKTYEQYFTVSDVSDPYDVKPISSSGDKLQNGVGSTTVTPQVYYGSAQVSNLTGWTFTWYFYDRNGKRCGFVDTAKIATAGGAAITANGTGASATITYSGTSYPFAAGDIVKAVKPDGTAMYYEVASSTTNIVTIRTPVTNTWLSFASFPAPSAITDFVGGKLFGCTAGGTRTTSGATAITVTGDDIDVKGNIVVEANRP